MEITCTGSQTGHRERTKQTYLGSLSIKLVTTRAETGRQQSKEAGTSLSLYPTDCKMLFFSYFKDLVGREVTVELKNDLAIRGTLHSVDQYLNIKLENTRVVDQDKYPHMLSVRNCFIRGSVVRYVQLPPDGVDVDLLHDATRREARGG
ncbi:hypothetical protein Ddye_016714 [Dipteronia dyeriana]|nr:hypothetical protein Ddye_016714 [Dipteronia dyeriana]